MYETLVALITPFRDDNLIDFEALRRIIDKLIEEGVDGFVVCGTTAETPTLSDEERILLYGYISEYVNRRVKLYAGVGSNNTIRALTYMKMASAFNYDGYLIVTPYYNLPTQQGLYEYYNELCKYTNKPIILYNVKKRCGVELESDTIMKLISGNKNIIGLKHSGIDYERYLPIKEKYPYFKLYCGDDNALLKSISIGYDGLISVAGHICLPLIKKIVNGNYEEEDLLFYAKYMHLLYIETSPVPLKYALKAKGISNEYVRSPLCILSEENKIKINEFLSRN